MTELVKSPFPLLITAALLAAFSGFPFLIPRLAVTSAHRIAAVLLAAASIIGLTGAISHLLTGLSERYVIAWSLPFGPAEIGGDPLSAWFLLPVFIVSGSTAFYALGYWPADRHPRTVRTMSLATGLLCGSLVILLMARHGVLFLMAWEVMAFSAFFALVTEDAKRDVRDAGLLYLVTAHIGSLALFALFALLRTADGGYTFPAAGTLTTGAPTATLIVVIALLGFGLKAGMMPLHVWLPSAHANAPSHISALLSGVVLKTGIYGLMRVFSFFPETPLWWGGMVLLLGVFSGVAGVVYALGQHDIKRLLAYHSIENIGIILMGLGVALLGRAAGSPLLVLLGIGGALLHVLNHALFKALLFLGAGSVIHATGCREIDLMGGLARRLPWTAALFLMGAAAISGLPPLNGFVSELLIYLGFFNAGIAREGAAAVMPMLAAPALALVGALALACFVKVYGIAFLGTARSEEALRGHESPVTMLAPMVLLAGLCVFIGLAPGAVAPLLDSAIRAWHPGLPPGNGIATAVPFGWLTALNLTLLLAVGLLWLWLRALVRRTPPAVAPTWGCGYLAPTPRMQYTASSFADLLVGFFRSGLRQEVHPPKIKGAFPAPASFGSHVPETILERIYLPALELLYRWGIPLRKLQHGQLHLYIFYTFVTLVVLLSLTRW